MPFFFANFAVGNRNFCSYHIEIVANTYRHEVMQPDDNPPIGLLLCTDYGKMTVQYATEGLSDKLFVSKCSALVVS